MAHRSKSDPGFRSEAEEASWYATPQGRRQTQREFERARRSGTLETNPKGLKVKRTNATQAMSIRLPVADIERA